MEACLGWKQVYLRKRQWQEIISPTIHVIVLFFKLIFKISRLIN